MSFCKKKIVFNNLGNLQGLMEKKSPRINISKSILFMSLFKYLSALRVIDSQKKSSMKSLDIYEQDMVISSIFMNFETMSDASMT